MDTPADSDELPYIPPPWRAMRFGFMALAVLFIAMIVVQNSSEFPAPPARAALQVVSGTYDGIWACWSREVGIRIKVGSQPTYLHHDLDGRHGGDLIAQVRAIPFGHHLSATCAADATFWGLRDDDRHRVLIDDGKTIDEAQALHDRAVFRTGVAVTVAALGFLLLCFPPPPLARLITRPQTPVTSRGRLRWIVRGRLDCLRRLTVTGAITEAAAEAEFARLIAAGRITPEQAAAARAVAPRVFDRDRLFPVWRSLLAPGCALAFGLMVMAWGWSHAPGHDPARETILTGAYGGITGMTRYWMSIQVGDQTLTQGYDATLADDLRTVPVGTSVAVARESGRFWQVTVPGPASGRRDLITPAMVDGFQAYQRWMGLYDCLPGLLLVLIGLGLFAIVALRRRHPANPFLRGFDRADQVDAIQGIAIGELLTIHRLMLRGDLAQAEAGRDLDALVAAGAIARKEADSILAAVPAPAPAQLN